MILADKIIALRKQNGWSQEELAEKLGVSRQSISKWEGAQSVPDLNRILAMSRIFGISTDILLKDDMDLASETQLVTADETPARRVSMEEANSFLKARFILAGRTAIGVMLCILSPILLIILSGMQEEGLIALSEDQAAGIGILVLMLLIGVAVAIFVFNDMKVERYKYLQQDWIETEYGVTGMVRERKESYHGTHMVMMVAGITLCVCSCIPLFIAMIISGTDLAMEIAVGLLLVLVAIGVLLIVRTSMIWDSFAILLEEGEFSREHKLEEKRNSTIMSLYWAIVTAVYLLISFLTRRWDMTWIIWPVAGVGCGILAAVLRVVRKNN